MDAVEYSIGVNNRFNLLAEDEDQVEDVQESTKEKKEKKTKNAPQRAVKDAKPQQTKKEKEAANEETRKDVRDNKKGGRGPKDGVKRENEKNSKISNGPHREDRENIPPSRGGKGGFNRRRENEGAVEGDSPAKDDKREERGTGMAFGSRGRGGRGGGLGRARGGFGGPRGGGRKREFERRSGSDRSGTDESTGLPTRRSVKPQDKRDGGGSFNWGNPADTGEGEVLDDKKAEWEEGAADQEEPKVGQTEETAQHEESEENEEQTEEPKQMTLEEWKEIQEKFRAKINYEVRKPGEGEKKGQWKNTHLLQKQAEEDERQQLYEEKLKTSGRVKQRVEGIQFFVSSDAQDTRRGGRGGRGGRGRGGGRGSGRGRGSRGGFGSNRDGGNPEFEINQDEFPTLA